MKKYFSIFLALLLCLTFVLSACGEEPAEPVKSEGNEPTKSDAGEPVKSDAAGSEGTDEPKEILDLVDMTDSEAYNKAMEAYNNNVTEVKNFLGIRLPLIVLPCNKTYHDRMEASINQMKDLLDQYPDKLYTAETYNSHYSMEGTWQGIMTANAASVGAGWIKNGGWFQTTIAIDQGDYYYALGRDNADCFRFDIFDETVNELAEYDGKTIDPDVIKAFKDVVIDLVDIAVDLKGWENCGAKWTSQTTDLDCRVIEQMYYDIMGDGVVNGENNSPFNVESMKKYKKVSAEDMDATVQMISDHYSKLAEKYTALKPYADAYASYVANRSSK